MNCEQFAGNWNAHVLGHLEARDESHMLEHSRACDACGTKWREHDELSVLLASVISPLKPADDVAARLAARLPPAQLPKPGGLAHSASPEPTLPVQSGPMLVAAFLGGMAMLAISGAGGGNNSMEQLAYAEMLSRGMGRSSGFSAATLGGTNFFGLLMALAFLVWITRASFWEILFPVCQPRSIILARWLAIPTVMLGALRLLLQLWIQINSWSTTMLQGRMADISTLGATSHLLDHVWRVGFWLTLLTLLFGMLDKFIARHARPLQ